MKNEYKKILNRTNDLIEDIDRNCNIVVDKPVPLKYKFSGSWGRKTKELYILVYKL